MKKLSLLAAAVLFAAFALSGCDAWWNKEKSASERMVSVPEAQWNAINEKAGRVPGLESERDKYKQLYEKKPDGLTGEQCTAMAKDIVEKSCTAKPPAHPAGAAKSKASGHRKQSGSTATATASAHGPGATATATASTGGAPAPAQQAAAVPAQPAAAAPAPQASSQRIWLWHPYTASDSHPEACVISSGTGAGLPPRCSSFTVMASLPNETKPEWLVRVAKAVRPTEASRPTDTGVYTKQ